MKSLMFSSTFYFFVTCFIHEYMKTFNENRVNFDYLKNKNNIMMKYIKLKFHLVKNLMLMHDISVKFQNFLLILKLSF